MASKHITEDEVNLLINAKVSQAQQEIRKFEKDIDKLESRNKSLRKQMDSLELAGKKDTESWKKRRAEYGKNVQEIKRLKQEIAEETKKLDINSLSMAQLRKQAKSLQKELDNTAKAIHPEEYNKLQQQLTKVKGRMEELRVSAQGIKESLLDDTTFSFLKGSIFVKLGELAGQAISYVIGKTKEMISEGIEMAKTSDGIRHAFEQMNRPDILDNLREATHGTVNDVELMKAAVQAKDFRLPLDQLGKYLEFAQLKASQTGQSVDYMTNSIITGLGRKSLMILDNLGLSAAQVKEEMAKGGDMATAVGRIIDKQLKANGEHYEDAAEREERAITEVQNAQRELGEEMLPLSEAGNNMWLTLQKGGLKFFTFLVRKTKEGVAKFVDLYNSSMIVRYGIVGITTTLKQGWNIVKFVAKFTIDAVKTVGKQLMNLGKIVEGVFTLDFGKVKDGFGGLFVDAWKGLEKQVKNAYDFGKDVGRAARDGFSEIWNGKITAPSFDKGGGLTGTAPTGNDDGNDDGTSGSKTPKAAASQDTLKQLKDGRQKALDQEKYFYEESLRFYKQQLADKLISQQQYDAIQLSLASAHTDRVLEAEKSHLEAINQLTLKDSKKKEDAVKEQQRNIEKAENDSQNARMAAYQNFQEKMDELRRSGMTDTELQQYDHQMQLAALKGYYQASLQYAQEHNEEILSIDMAYQKAKEKLEKEFELQNQKDILDIRQQYGLVKQEELYNQELKILKQHLEQKKLTQEEYEQAVANLHQQYEDRKFQVRQQYGLVSQAELWEQQKEQLLQQHEDGYLTEAEYQEALKQMRMESWKEQFDYYHQLFADAVGALQDADMANIDAKYDAEIEAARKAGKDVTAIENKKANEKLKIEKKYADVDFAIKAAQIVADTVVGITKVWASPGYPMAIPLTVLLAALGAANLVVANAQRQKVKSMTLNGGGGSGASGARAATGREEGGYLDVEREQDGRRFHAKYDPKKRGYVNQPTVIVGEGPRPKEWIASNDAVENPTVAPLINVLDQMQRAGTIRTFDLNKYLMQKQTRGLASGGSISSSPTGSVPSTNVPPIDTDQTRRLADILERIDRDGLPVFLGLDEFDAKQQILNRSRNIAKKE